MRALLAFILLSSLLLSPGGAAGDDVWVAVGYGGRRMISTDGLKWEITAEWAQPGGDDGNNLMSAVFAQDKFVVVGGGGGGRSGAGHILVSRDGRQWKETFSGKSRINPVVYGDGRFVVGSSGYPSGKLLWSADAETWTAGAAIETKGLTHFRGGAYGNGVFVLVGNAGGQGGRSWAIVTPDGEKITSERDDLPGHGAIVFGAGKFLMLTSHREAELIASRDGATWAPVHPEEGAKFSWLVSSGGEFFAGDGKVAYRSADGATWKKQELPVRGGVKWTDGTRFISTSWPGKMAFSADGASWESSPPLSANGINRVIHGDLK
ncbi:MAG: hypothetical protein RIC55_04415 [Pirellulaceae bacterium]